MKIFIEKEGKQLELSKECKGHELLAELKINPTTVILVRNGEVTLPEETLSNKDDIVIISVVSGG
ncbi:MoaD/ThiS family protein [Candidatus Woesearchaeota archaeon]|nr:MoaD/ThiS family protein [Candidatus Woesearchaeota archaeon]